ncbi:YsnF/AvaK domain-containing protein [Pseudomonas asuensis]|uniref:DUF2382 domain-containing protein n=1 Tax=Pseudomonas asuensis TaxID=1825787 RepID=A0ABQ2GXH1_9PSED|nr:YsnF/AvaK domain-containing protein [Pseudomonas asuensis]GGM18415.1 hypothetical protein GCM10009425_31760 [Pseudomonas asuensis]
MQHTLVAAFDRYNEAELVKRELMAKGVSQTNIQIAAANEAGVTEGTTDTSLRSDTHDGSMSEKVGHFFRSVFGSDDTEHSRYGETYSEAVRRGSTVVTVTVNDDAQVPVVEDILERNGAIDIDERSATWTSEGATAYPDTMGDSTVTGSTSRMAPTAGATTATTMGVGATPLADQTPTETTAIPVMEEELKVGKRENRLGRVRVVSHMTERPVEETVSLREEHAVIERRPVDRAVSTSDLSAFREGTVEIQETAEEAVVAKTARVVEEVVVGKESTQHTETVRDTVRRTDVDIEKDGTRSHLSGTHDADTELTTRNKP